MSDYIRREDAVNTVIPAMVDGADAEIVEGLIYMIEPADVVSVVRCADCERSEYDVVFEQYWCNLKRIVRPDGYCNYGKRREE